MGLITEENGRATVPIEPAVRAIDVILTDERDPAMAFDELAQPLFTDTLPNPVEDRRAEQGAAGSGNQDADKIQLPLSHRKPG